MPKKGRGKRGMDQIVRVPFRQLQVNTIGATATTVTEFDCTVANLGTRVVNMAKNYEWFRFRQLRASLITSIGTTVTLSGQIGLSWCDTNAAASGTITTQVQQSQYELFTLGNMYTKLQLEVAKDRLASLPYKWFATTSTGVATDETSAGLFVITAANDTANNTTNTVFLVEGVLEFRGMIDSAVQSLTARVHRSPEIKDESDDDDMSVLEVLMAEEPVDPYLEVNNPRLAFKKRCEGALKRLQVDGVRTGGKSSINGTKHVIDQ